MNKRQWNQFYERAQQAIHLISKWNSMNGMQAQRENESKKKEMKWNEILFCWLSGLARAGWPAWIPKFIFKFRNECLPQRQGKFFYGKWMWMKCKRKRVGYMIAGNIHSTFTCYIHFLRCAGFLWINFTFFISIIYGMWSRRKCRNYITKSLIPCILLRSTHSARKTSRARCLNKNEFQFEINFWFSCCFPRSLTAIICFTNFILFNCLNKFLLVTRHSLQQFINNFITISLLKYCYISLLL